VETTGDAISANQFPVLLLEENWVNNEEQRRACEYIKWISPSLLTLHHLDKGTRTRTTWGLSLCNKKIMENKGTYLFSGSDALYK